MFSYYKEVLKSKYFKYLWSSQIFSQITLNILNFILLIRLFDITGSSIATSFLWVIYALPAIFFGPIASASVDLVDKKKLLIITNLLQAFIVFIYALLYEKSIFLLYFVVFSYSFFNQFYIPSEAATLPFILKEKTLAFANSLFFITQQLGLILGFGISGVLLRTLGFRISLFLCSIFLAFAFFVCLFLPNVPSKKVLSYGIFQTMENFFRTINEGYRYIRSQKFILAPILLMIISQISLAIVAFSVPPIAKYIFEISLDKAGVYIVVPAGFGALIGAILIPKFLRDGVRKIYIIKTSLLAISLGIFFMVFIVPLFQPFFKIILGIFCIILIGISYMGTFIPNQTLLQEKTSLEYRGRVFGNLWFIVTITSILPAIISGVIIELLSIRMFLFIMGLLYLGLYLGAIKGERLLLNNIK